MVQTTYSIAISATAEQVWQTLMAVEAYPQWTRSMTRVVRLDPGRVGAPELVVGEQVRITQPKLGSLTWTVTAVEPARQFDWVAKRGTITATATHRITPNAGGGVTLELGVTQQGLGAGLVRRLTGKLTRRYVTMEAEGCKARSEGRVTA